MLTFIFTLFRKFFKIIFKHEKYEPQVAPVADIRLCTMC